MAFGDVKGTLSGSGGSQTATPSAVGSVGVAVGDLVYANFAEQNSLTVGGTPGDNLGNTYAWCNAGNDGGSIAGRTAWSVVTTAGTLSSVNASATASTNDYANFAVVIEGPFAPNANQPVANPSNITNDTTNPVTCPSTGSLPAVPCAVMSFASRYSSASIDGYSPTTLIGEAASGFYKSAVCIQLVSDGSDTTPSLNTQGVSIVVGTTAFKSAAVFASVDESAAIGDDDTGQKLHATRVWGGYSLDYDLAPNASGYTFRVILGTSLLAEVQDGSIGVTLEFGAGTDGSVGPVYVGHQAVSGDAYDFDGSQVQLTFDGGNPTKSVSGQSSVSTDKVAFDYDSSRPLIVSFYVSGTVINLKWFGAL